MVGAPLQQGHCSTCEQRAAAVAVVEDRVGELSRA